VGAVRHKDPEMKKTDSIIAPHLRSIMDAIPSFAFAVDRDVRIIEYNTAAGTLLDKNRISIINQEKPCTVSIRTKYRKGVDVLLYARTV